MTLTRLTADRLLKRLAVALLFVVLIFGLFFSLIHLKESLSVRLDDSFDIEIQRTGGRRETYNQNSFPALTEGDHFVIRIPASMVEKRLGPACLVFSLTNCSIRVTTGEEVLYDETEEPPSLGQEKGDIWYHIDLPDTVTSDIRIEGTVMRSSRVSLIQDMMVIPSGEAWKQIIGGHEAMFAILIVLIVIALLCSVLFLVQSVAERKMADYFYLALFGLLYCMWYFSHRHFHLLISDMTLFNENIEYLCAFSMLIPLSFFYRARLERLKSSQVAGSIGIASVVFFIMTTIIHFSPLPVCFNEMVPQLTVLNLIAMSCFFRDEYREGNKTEEPADRILHGGLLLALALGIAGLAVILINQKSMNRMDPGVLDLIPLHIGVIAAMLLIAGLLRFAEDTSVTQHEAEKLHELAYIDQLTGAPNRSAVSEKLELIIKRNLSDYVIIFFDVNNLKTTNDQFGHEYGDKLICETARLLMENFTAEEKRFCGRWGGDEFLACVLGTEEEGQEAIRQFRNGMKEVNQRKLLPIELSVSVGAAASTRERPLKLKYAIKLADQNMYEQKRQSKMRRPMAT